jgi:hypothetical protein
LKYVTNNYTFFIFGSEGHEMVTLGGCNGDIMVTLRHKQNMDDRHKNVDLSERNIEKFQEFQEKYKNNDNQFTPFLI